MQQLKLRNKASLSRFPCVAPKDALCPYFLAVRNSDLEAGELPAIEGGPGGMMLVEQVEEPSIISDRSIKKTGMHAVSQKAQSSRSMQSLYNLRSLI